MKRCPHEGPHYRSVPKGEIGPWLCKDCLAQTEHEPESDVIAVAEEIDALRVEMPKLTRDEIAPLIAGEIRAALAEQAEWWAGSPLRVDGSGAMWQATVGDGAQRRVVGMGDTAVGAARAGLACLVSIAAQERTMRERALAEQAEEHARELAQARAEVWEEAANMICTNRDGLVLALRARAAELRGKEKP